jgi:hypothetical protein
LMTSVSKLASVTSCGFAIYISLLRSGRWAGGPLTAPVNTGYDTPEGYVKGEGPGRTSCPRSHYPRIS